MDGSAAETARAKKRPPERKACFIGGAICLHEEGNSNRFLIFVAAEVTRLIIFDLCGLRESWSDS
jgi:hypothetical protein